MPPLPLWCARTLALGLPFCAGVALAATVTRVDPPYWWAGHSHNPVRVMVTGAGLTGAHLEPPRGVAAERLRVNDAGTHLFADLHLPSTARPGPLPLRVVTSGGGVTVPFSLLPALPRHRGFDGFSPDDVLYLVMPDRFANGDPSNDDPPVSPGLLDRSKPRHYHGGDLRGLIDRLPYLRDLGITAVWTTPWYDNVNHLNELEKYTADNRRSPEGVPSTDYHGYGAVDFYAVEERFGDLATLQRFVKRAHRRGMKVIQDQVANHTGPYHPWAKAPPTPTWFNGTVAQHRENTWQTWTVAHPDPPPDQLAATLDGWFINLLPDLNQNDPETSTYLIQNSLWWLGVTGLDGIRQDTLPYVPRTHWARWTTALKREHPRLTVLGEMWDGDPKLVAFFQGGRARFDGVDSGIDTLFDFPLHYAIRDVFAKGASMRRLSETLAADTHYVDARVLVTFLGLHDTPRFLNENGATVTGLKLAFAYLCTTRGTPLIYYGDEIAMRGGGDPDNRRDFPGGWRDDPRNAFRRSGRTPEQNEVHAHLRKLLTLRRKLEPLRRGDLTELLLQDTVYAFARSTPRESVVIVFNNADHIQEVEVPLARTGLDDVGTLRDRLGELGRLPVSQGKLKAQVPARSAAILTP